MDFDIGSIFLALIVLINPFYAAMAIYLDSTRNQTMPQKVRYAAIAALSIFITILLFSLTGSALLKFLGISLGSFQIAGGILVFIIAINIMNGSGNPAKPSEDDINAELYKSNQTASAVVPLAIPMMIGPAGISTVIIYASSATDFSGVLTIITAGLLIALINFALLIASTRVNIFLGETGVNILSRIMGMLLAAVAVEIFVTGVRTTFNLPLAL